MEIHLTWETLGKVVLAGSFAYVIAPILLVVRDLLVIQCLEKFVLTDNFRATVLRWACAKWSIDHQYTKVPGWVMDKQGVPTGYTIDQQSVSEQQFQKYVDERNEKTDQVMQLGAQITFRTNLVAGLLKRYRLPPSHNPIKQWVDDSLKDAAQFPARVAQAQKDMKKRK